MIRDYPKGQILFFKGDKVTQMYRIIYGAIKVYEIDDQGNEHILTIRSGADVFPMSAVIERPTAEFYYETLTESQLEIVPLGEYQPDEMLRQAVKLYFEALHRIASLEGDASHRVRQAITYAHDHDVKPTQEVVGKLANTTRETVSTVLKKRRGKNAKS